MATIDDLNYESITEMSNDEAIELLRQIRLTRRMPSSNTSTRKPKAKASTSTIDAATASELLKILGGK